MFCNALTDFNLLPYNIPNLDGVVADTFPDFIDAQEQQQLVKLLGQSFYDSFVAGLNALPDDYDPAVTYHTNDEVVFGTTVWKSISVADLLGIEPVEGADWTAVETDNRWLLLKLGNSYLNTVSRKKAWCGMQTMLKPFVYSQWLRATATSWTGNGVVTPTTENADQAGPGTMISNSFNDFSKRAFNCGNDDLYGYLYANRDNFSSDFDDSYSTFSQYLSESFQKPGQQNVFDL